VARNGKIYNTWTLSLKTGELKQYSDAVGGNLYTVVLREGSSTPRIGVITYYKGEYELHTLERRDPIVTAASSDFGSPSSGPPINFQAPLSHTLVAEKKKKKGTFEKMFMDGRPPVNVGVTSGGDIFYGTLENVFYDPSFSGYIDRDFSVATRTVRGGTAFGIWPFNRYRRVEVFGGMLQYRESFNDPNLQDYSVGYQEEQFGRQLLRSGTYIPLGINFVQETTVFREFGPLAGNTMRLSYEIAPKIGNTLSRQTADIDARYYQRLGATGLLALRARGFRSWGDAPDFMYFGGNSEMRGYEYLEFVGDHSAFFNAELRFPLIEAMLTPIGILGGIRGVFFANLGGGYFKGQQFRWFARDAELYTPIIGYEQISFTQQRPVYGATRVVDGFRLVDSRASYGIGLETFALGFPIHFDYSWKTLLNKDWEDQLFAAFGGSSRFRKPKFTVWIGYDF
jgi:hypothetical protein